MAQPYDIHGNLTKRACEQPDPQEGIICAECEGTGKVVNGECKVAMSGPTCMNPDCPPCQTPETRWCPDCGGRGKP